MPSSLLRRVVEASGSHEFTHFAAVLCRQFLTRLGKISVRRTQDQSEYITQNFNWLEEESAWLGRSTYCSARQSTNDAS